MTLWMMKVIMEKNRESNITDDDVFSENEGVDVFNSNCSNENFIPPFIPFFWYMKKVFRKPLLKKETTKCVNFFKCWKKHCLCGTNNRLWQKIKFKLFIPKNNIVSIHVSLYTQIFYILITHFIFLHYLWSWSQFQKMTEILRKLKIVENQSIASTTTIENDKADLCM